MKGFNNFDIRTLILSAGLVTAASLMSFAGCTKVDDTLGSNLIPDEEQMAAGYTTLGAQWLDGKLNPKQYVETRLYQTDSLVSSNISYGYMGSSLNDTFGLRNAGFLTQYFPYTIDSGYFGFQPILDSAVLLISISSYGSDTLTPQKYNVYEVISNNYLTDKPIAPGKTVRDSSFYITFDPAAEGVIGTEPIFTFTFPDGVKSGPASTYVTMQATDAGRDFVNRLMLQEGTYKNDYSIYGTDSLEQWFAEFKGIYIVPSEGQTSPMKGNIYATALETSGFAFYGRNRVASDPTLIKDTLTMPYIFYDKTVSKYGNVSINTVKHDYSKATSPEKFDIADAVETNDNRPLSTQIYVEGLGGVVTELTFTEEFFNEMNAIIAQKNTETGKNFKTIAMNQVQMSVYFTGSNYDWNKIQPTGPLLDQMDAGQSRLGLYVNYKKLTPIADYPYSYEASYSSELPYGGYINHSRASYVMNISSQVQSMWNYYLQAVEELGADAPWSEIAKKIKNLTIYLGPQAYGLYEPNYSVMQGMTPDGVTMDDVPIKFDITYTLVK